jgi:hypothetical protein
MRDCGVESETRSRKLGRTYLKRTDTTLDLSQKAKRAKDQKEGRRATRLYRHCGLGTLVDHVIA